MAKQKNTGQDAGLVSLFNDMKKKHPDAMLLFRNGEFYELYKQDAVKASVILALEISQKILSKENDSIKFLTFPRHELDTHLPKLIRSGERVAICDSLETLKKEKEESIKQSQKTEAKEALNSKQETMAKKKTEKAAQEEPAKTVKTAAGEKPAKEKKTEAKAETKAEAKVDAKADSKAKVETKAETKTESKVDAKVEAKADSKAKVETKAETKAEVKSEQQERKPREPQMVTANGDKVSHGHAYQSTTNKENWYFTAKINGEQLKPQKMDAADLAAYQKKEITVPELMEKYYPTKLMPKVSEEAFRMPKQLSGPDGAITIDKFNVYKEKDEQRPDYGKYKFYAQMGDTKMSAVASRQDLNAYFDRVVSPAQLVEKNFGERLHLKSAYEKYQLPDGVDPKGVRVAKDHGDNKWKVSMDLGDKGKTSKHEISFDDGYSLFKAKTATREQIAAKYLNTEISGLLTNSNKMEKSASIKM